MVTVKLKALKPFRDITDKSVVNVGDVLETQDVKRANNLISRGLATVAQIEVAEDADKANGVDGGEGGKAPAGTPGKVAFRGAEYDPQVIKDAMVAVEIPVAPNAGEKGIANRLTQLTEDQANALAEKLTNKE